MPFTEAASGNLNRKEAGRELKGHKRNQSYIPGQRRDRQGGREPSSTKVRGYLSDSIASPV